MKKNLVILLSLITVAGCSMVSFDDKKVAADRIARPAFMVDRMIEADGFQIKVWERMHEPYESATLYIEGDGHHWDLKPKSPIDNPTPANPVALHLASRDLSENVAYLARPCQYIYNPEDKGCSSNNWSNNRYSREIINAYHTTLNEMKAQYNIKDFHLVGFDGGAAIAAYLAAERDDVQSLRTVNGVLNHAFMTSEKSLPPLNGSLNPIDIAPALAKVPQIHFIGGADDMVTPGVYHSYRQAMGTSDCIHYSMVQDASHYLGWVEKWPDLLKIQPACKYGEPEEFDMKAYNARLNKDFVK